MTKPKPPLSRRLLLSAGTFALVFALFFAAEGVLRLVTNDPNPGLADYWDHLLEQTAPCAAARAAGDRRPGATRIAVVGESSGEFLGEGLRLAATGFSGLDVVSCGVSASSLEQIATRFEEVRRTHPDAVVVVLGHNLEKKYPDDRGAIRLQALLARSRLLSLLAGGLRQDRPGNVAISERLPLLEAFLRRAAEEAKTDGFKLVFSTVTPNFWLPPFRTPSDTRPANADAALYDARWSYATGARDQAISQLSELEARSHDGHLAYELGEWLAAAGEKARAREAFERAIAFGTNRVVQPTNDLIRRVARETGTGLRDMLADSERAASDGIPGWETVEDNCHLYRPLFLRQGTQLVRELAPPDVAEAFAKHAKSSQEPLDQLRIVAYHVKALRRAEQQGERAGNATNGLDYVLRSYASAVFRLLHELGPEAPVRLDRAVAEALARDPLGDETRAGLLLATADGEWKAGLRERARAHLAESKTLHSSASAAKLEGLWDAADGKLDEAAKAFEAALALDASDAESRLYLAKSRAH